MRLARPGIRASRIAFAVMVVVSAVGARLPSALAQDDSDRFAEILDSRSTTSSLAGPLSGELIQADGFSVTTGAGLTTEDFSATATFENPSGETDTPWDFGFTFHATPDAAQQVVLDSEGVWYYSPFPGGTLESGFVPDFDATPGGTNTLDLIVEGTTALLGVNSQFLASLDLPPAISADVQVGSGYFTNTTQKDRTIAYRGFEVWPLPGAAASRSEPESEPAGTQESPVAVQPTPAVSPGDAEAFELLLASQLGVDPLAGPFTANLTEEGRIALSWADVDLRDFHARAVFAVPETPSDIPWSIGFMFRNGPGGTLRVSVDNGGNWYASAGTTSPEAFGLVTGLVTEPGGANTLDLFVADDGAVLGVNGNFGASIDLAPGSGPADVAVGAAFYNDQTLPERVVPFRDFVVLPFDPDAVSVPAESPATTDADAFASYAAETESVAPAVGPLAGRLVESTAGTVPAASAGVALADFGATVGFVTPTDVTDGLWDAGFQFRSDANVTHRLAVGFSGEVYAVLPGESPRVVGTATTFDPTPGAVNTLQLFVTGDRALVGVNGEFVAAITLATAPVASDIQVGAAFFDEDFVQNRVTAYEGFSIWEIV